MDIYDKLNDIDKKNYISSDDMQFIKANYDINDIEVRREIAELLVLSDEESSKFVLLKYLDDNDELVRINACDSLCIFYEREVVDRLIHSSSVDEDELVRAYAILSISDILYSKRDLLKDRDISFLKSKIANDKSKFVQIASISCLIRLGDSEYMTVFLNYLNEEDYGIRAFLIGVITEVWNEENENIFAGYLKNHLKDEDTVAVRSKIEKILREKNYSF